MDDDQNQPQSVESSKVPPVGERLRHKRESLGLSLEDVAKQLHLELGFLRALEADDFDNLPWPAYIKGYIRSYSQLLGLDSGVLIADYQSLTSPVEPELKPTVSDTRDYMALRTRVYAIGSFLALIFVMLAVWLYTHDQRKSAVHSQTTKVTKTSSNAATPSINSPLMLLKQKAENTPVSPVTASSTVSKKKITAAKVKPAPLVTTTPKATLNKLPASQVAGANSSSVGTKQVTGQSTLVLELTHQSWVQVTDAKGNQLAYGLMKSGTKKIFKGVAPFSVFLGYASAAKISIQGHPVDISSYIQSNHTARLKIKASSGISR